jgi:hypothetical protein
MKTLRYHTLINSSSKITRAALDAEKELLFLEFPNATYSYHRPGIAEAVFNGLTMVKDYASTLTEQEIIERQESMPYKIGSEGSYALKHIVGLRKDPFPFVKLTPEEAAEVWAGMEVKESEVA